MALQNEILVGRFNRALQKLLGIKGGPPAPQVAPEFVPRLSVPDGLEEAYLWGYDLFGGTFLQPATALQFSGVRIRNPAGSRVAVEIIRWFVFNGVSADAGLRLRAGPTISDDATLFTPFITNLDPRGRLLSTSIPSGGIVGIPGPAILTFPLAASPSGIADLVGNQTPKSFLPMLPGWGYQVIGSVVNNALSCSIWWRERPMEESELT